jgi:hypothetical protein
LADKRFDWLPGSLFHELDQSLQQEFYDLLQELKRCFVSFVEIGKSYGAGSYDPPSAPKQIAGGEAQIIDNEERAKAHQKAISWVKKVVWSAKDKKAVTEIVKDIEHWTDLLRITIQDVVTNSPGLRELDRLDHIGKGLSEQAADLQLALSIRRILLTKPKNLSEPAPVIPMTDVSILSTIDGITLGTLHSSQANVLIEKKNFGAANPTDDVQRLAKSKHLATLLQHVTDPASRVLNAQGYNYDPLQLCATIVYGIPSSLLPSPTTLQQLYTTRLQEARPSLEIRFQLALVVTESLFFLHSLGWVHKSFSSSHVLFFPQRALRNNPWPADGHALERVSIDQILRQSDIKIAGFELSRPEAEQSSLSMHGDAAENFYRHPARWGLPTEEFTFSHDLYGKCLAAESLVAAN